MPATPLLAPANALYRPAPFQSITLKRSIQQSQRLISNTSCSRFVFTPVQAGKGLNDSETNLPCQALFAAPALLPLWLTGAAAAADVDIDDAVLDAAYSAEYSQSTGSTDLLVSVLATVVFVLLAVVTAGVAFLTLKSWLDDRQEKQDRDGTGRAPAAGFTAVGSEEEEPEKKRVRMKREKRGFGGQ